MNEPTPEQLAKLPKWASSHIIMTEQQRDINRSLSWQSYKKPTPFPSQSINFGDKLKTLWFQNNYDDRFEISLGCSNGSCHSRSNPDKTNSQGAGTGYITRLDALKVARCEMAQRFAIALAKIDAQINKDGAQ